MSASGALRGADGGAGPVSSSDSPARVLIADDEATLRRALARPLAKAGIQVVEAADGREAAELVNEQSFDVIVSDIAMPAMDGIQLLRIVRERDLDVPVVLMTGVPDVRTAMEAVEHGALEYLTKPVDLNKFERVMERAIRLNRMARMKREALALLGQHNAQAGDRAGLEASFDRALDTLWIAYQPIVRAEDRSLFGHEALLRSSEPSLPHPGAVLDAAERLNRLGDLGRKVRATAAGPVANSAEAGVLFVNLHTRDLLDDTLWSKDAPLSQIASRVVLEITERSSLDDVRDARARVARLREMGFRIAIDDLGAGYAGLTSFAQLEPEIVKLDMSLVRDVHLSTTKQKLIRSMTSLCRNMGMMVVAEGVETVEEREAVIELGCDFIQGYLLAKPGRPFPKFTW